jgi:DNA-binding Lrp family transcriptional regulator
VDAFVFVRARPGRVEDVVTQVQASKGVRHAVAVVGDWDVVAAMHGADLTSIALDVTRSLHNVDGIERTLTAPVVPAHVTGVAGGGLGVAAPMHRAGDACYVRIATEPDAVSSVFEALAEMDDVSGVALIAGAYDMLAEVPHGWEEAARVISDRIRKIPGVRSTNTLVAVPALPVDDEDRDQFSAWS